ncbi:MAG: hypothetical protein GX100_01640 [candidate division WS1 bacterium]|jgi:hypothetical protein|nr:hypothetical protein [candidate division WS1 bacterium]
MREIITLQQMDTLVLWVTLGGAPVGLFLGALVRGLFHRRQAAWQGLFLGLVASGIGLLWLFFRWTVRVDPVGEYVGLYRPGVLFLDALVFLALGLGLGWLWRKIRDRNET